MYRTLAKSTRFRIRKPLKVYLQINFFKVVFLYEKLENILRCTFTNVSPTLIASDQGIIVLTGNCFSYVCNAKK